MPVRKISRNPSVTEAEKERRRAVMKAADRTRAMVQELRAWDALRDLLSALDGDQHSVVILLPLTRQ